MGDAKFGFSSFAEQWNGRLAMMGFVIGLGTELLTGQGILHQIGLGWKRARTWRLGTWDQSRTLPALLLWFFHLCTRGRSQYCCSLPLGISKCYEQLLLKFFKELQSYLISIISIEYGFSINQKLFFRQQIHILLSQKKLLPRRGFFVGKIP